MSQLVTGATNIIAIDSIKKDTFVKKYNEAIMINRQTQQVVEQPIFTQQPIDFNPAAPVEPVVQQEQNVTNADILSQSFDINPPTNIINNNPSIETNNLSTQNVSENNELMDVVYEIAAIQDKLDKIMEKVLKLAPEKKVFDEPVATTNLYEQSISNAEINAPASVIQNNFNNEISPFASSGNIFDEPQGPSLSA